MDTKEVAFMCELWNDILQRFNKLWNDMLQRFNSLMKSLDQFVTECRETFDSYGVKAYHRSGNKSYKFESESRRAPKHKKQGRNQLIFSGWSK